MTLLVVVVLLGALAVCELAAPSDSLPEISSELGIVMPPAGTGDSSALVVVAPLASVSVSCEL